MKHYATYAVRRKLIGMISPEWFDVLDVDKDFLKLIVKKRYRHRERIKYVLKKQRKNIKYVQ